MESKYTTRKFSNRVRAKDEDTSSAQPQQSHQDMDPMKQQTASSQSTDRSFQPAQQGYSSKYHFVHDELSHPDELSRPEE
ncbi:hypothetical protein BDV26DRAFT_292646 [Aspergillus bertholletiae]|uniref:Uncharacterized protein n=1 Tax=Aspergillus bertholletiae TaxID=1226010 RepID=A0A5N7B8F7_9EURO|nr:hypothetical protein BDV26DRAFT_292646 [Aspergillus bertholletiae]